VLFGIQRVGSEALAHIEKWRMTRSAPAMFFAGLATGVAVVATLWLTSDPAPVPGPAADVVSAAKRPADRIQRRRVIRRPAPGDLPAPSTPVGQLGASPESSKSRDAGRIAALEAELAVVHDRDRRAARITQCRAYLDDWADVSSLNPYDELELFTVMYSWLLVDRTHAEIQKLVDAMHFGLRRHRALLVRATRTVTNEDGSLSTSHDPAWARITGDDWRAAKLELFEALKADLREDEQARVRNFLLTGSK